MEIAIGIMAHAQRSKQATDLYSEVGADLISVDDGSLGENLNGDLVWRMIADHHPRAQWGVVLQDDAVPVPNLRAHLEEALAVAPHTAVGLYVGTCRPRTMQVIDAVEQAEEQGASWLEADNLLWGVGVAMPTSMIHAFLAWAKGTDAPYDSRIGAWIKSRSQLVRYTWPSLVDHADGPSILDQQGLRVPRECPRVAHKVGVPASWAGPVVRIANRGARLR